MPFLGPRGGAGPIPGNTDHSTCSWFVGGENVQIALNHSDCRTIQKHRLTVYT